MTVCSKLHNKENEELMAFILNIVTHFLEVLVCVNVPKQSRKNTVEESYLFNSKTLVNIWVIWDSPLQPTLNYFGQVD